MGAVKLTRLTFLPTFFFIQPTNPSIQPAGLLPSATKKTEKKANSVRTPTCRWLPPLSPPPPAYRGIQKYNGGGAVPTPIWGDVYIVVDQLQWDSACWTQERCGSESGSVFGSFAFDFSFSFSFFFFFFFSSVQECGVELFPSAVLFFSFDWGGYYLF